MHDMHTNRGLDPGHGIYFILPRGPSALLPRECCKCPMKNWKIEVPRLFFLSFSHVVMLPTCKLYYEKGERDRERGVCTLFALPISLTLSMLTFVTQQIKATNGRMDEWTGGQDDQPKEIWTMLFLSPRGLWWDCHITILLLLPLHFVAAVVADDVDALS